MASKRRNFIASALVALATHASAQVASVCPSSDVCFKLNIPESTASLGEGDIFFQISAPSDYEWVALGQGNGMVGSNIFVVYTSADGNNVTVSPRLATRYTMPTLNENAEVTLLEGSGVSGGKMVANVKCSNCRSWPDGSAVFTSGGENWVFAVQSSGGPKNSDDRNAQIRQHDNARVFQWSYANAKGGDSANPLLNVAPGPGPTTSCVPRPAGATAGATPTSSRTDDDDDDDRDDDDGRYGPGYGPPTGYPGWPTASPTAPPWHHDKRQEINYCDEEASGGFNPIGLSPAVTRQRKMLIAHGTLAALAFVILFPSGAILIRLASFSGLWWIHGAFQVFAYLTYIAGFGLGVYLANELDAMTHYHPVIGIVLFIVLLFMPVFGYLHHAMFKKVGRRTFWSHTHIWLGRSAITLGIINGGLGLNWADSMSMSSKSGMIAYAVVAGVMWLAWVAASVVGERRRKTARGATVGKYADSPSSETGLRDLPPPENGHYAPK